MYYQHIMVSFFMRESEISYICILLFLWDSIFLMPGSNLQFYCLPTKEIPIRLPCTYQQNRRLDENIENISWHCLLYTKYNVNVRYIICKFLWYILIQYRCLVRFGYKIPIVDSPVSSIFYKWNWISSTIDSFIKK